MLHKSPSMLICLRSFTEIMSRDSSSDLFVFVFDSVASYQHLRDKDQHDQANKLFSIILSVLQSILAPKPYKWSPQSMVILISSRWWHDDDHRRSWQNNCGDFPWDFRAWIHIPGEARHKHHWAFGLARLHCHRRLWHHQLGIRHLESISDFAHCDFHGSEQVLMEHELSNM